MSNLQDRITGMFYGIAIGDALGRAVETFTLEEIQEYLSSKNVEDGLVKEYYRPDGHKWFDGQEAGGITDDTMLSLAVADGLAKSYLDMDAQAVSHIDYFNEDPEAGYGKSTKNSIRAIINGSNWRKSATGSGVGNGIPMKIAPVAAHMRIAVPNNLEKKEWFAHHQQHAAFMVNLTGMTHKSDLSVSSAFAHYTAVYECLSKETPSGFSEHSFVNAVTAASKSTNMYVDESDGFQQIEDKLEDRLSRLSELKDFSASELADELDGGSCYVYNSLPFTYAFFLKNPHSIDSLYQVVSAGGDTDTNGSMLGAMLGALHGTSIFPQNLIDGLKDKDRVEAVAKNFYESCLWNK